MMWPNQTRIGRANRHHAVQPGTGRLVERHPCSTVPFLEAVFDQWRLTTTSTQ